LANGVPVEMMVTTRLRMDRVVATLAFVDMHSLLNDCRKLRVHDLSKTSETSVLWTLMSAWELVISTVVMAAPRLGTPPM
jgi:hypothetical protein